MTSGDHAVPEASRAALLEDAASALPADEEIQAELQAVRKAVA